MAPITSTFTAPWDSFSGIHCTQLTRRNLMTSADWYLHVSAMRTVSYLLVQPHKNKSQHLACSTLSRYLYAYWLTPSGQSNSVIVSGNVNTQEETGLCVTLTHLIWFLELDHTFGQLRAQRGESKTNVEQMLFISEQWQVKKQQLVKSTLLFLVLLLNSYL